MKLALLRAPLLVVGLLFSAASASAQTTHIVDTQNLSFTPANITIAPGDSVKWINLSPGNHNVAETDCPASTSSMYNGGFYSGFPNQVAEFTVQFNTPGQVCYICEPHVPAGMFGTITIGSPVPTLGEWGLISMGALFALAGGLLVARRV